MGGVIIGYEDGDSPGELEVLIEKYDGVVFHFLGNLKHFPRKEDVSEHTYDAVATLEKARDTERKAFTFMRDSSMAAGTE